VSAQCVRERLNKQRERKTFVAQIHSAQRQYRATAAIEKNLRIVRRMSVKL
jgi:hypothetical protein